MATMLSTKMQEQQQQQQQFPPEQDHHLKQDHVVHHDPSWYPKEISDEATRPSRRHPSHSSSKGDYDDHGGINLSTISNNEKDLLLLHRPPSLFSVTAVIKIQKAVRIFLKKKKLNDCTNEKKETLTNCREEEEEEEAFAAVVLSSDCKDQQRKRCLSEIISLLKDHLDVRDRMYRFKTYKNCFVASEAIDYMIKTNIVSTRQEGVEFGRLLQIHSHLWHHVCNHHAFKDDYLFFKFTTASNDERKEGERMMMLSLSYDDSRISDITMLDFVRSSTMISSYCEEISEDVSLLDPWGSSASSSSSSSKGKEERSNERKADSSIINNVSKGNNNSIKTSSSSSSSSLQQSKVITSPNKEARGIQRPPFKLPHKRLYTKNNRQLSAETDTAVIADCPVSLPVRRESALQMLDYDVSSLTFSYDDTTISANTRRSCNILNNGSNSITTDSSSSGHGRVVDNNNKNDFTRKKEATMSSEFHVVADDSPIQPPKRRQSKLSIPHNHHHTTIMEDIPSSIRESSSRRNDDDDLHIKNSKTQTTSMRRSELDNNMVVVASGDSPIQPPKRRQSEAVDTIDMTSYTSSSSSSFGCCNTTIDIQNDNHSSSSSSNNRSWSSRNGIINNDLQQQRFLASPSSSPHNLKKKKNVTSSEGVVAQTQQNRTIDSPLNVPKRRVSDDKNTVNT